MAFWGRKNSGIAAPVAKPAPTMAERAQSRLLSALVSPGDRSPVEVVALERAAGAIRTGVIYSASGKRVGRIENFQIDFVRPGEGGDLAAYRAETQAGALPREIGEVPERRLVPHSDPRIHYTGPTIAIEDPTLIVVEQAGAIISFEARGEIEIRLYAHPWSGEIEVRHGGETTTCDLYAAHAAFPRSLFFNLGDATQLVEIVVTGRKNPVSGGPQCLFGGFYEQTGRMTPLRHVKEAKVRGAPFTAHFHELLARVPSEGLLLDVGGGNRQIDDARYINSDYADFLEPDLIADATKLPLADNSIDAVHSTGVFEHIVDPRAAGAEVARVMKPGARAVIAWAFMQPIHSEGQHFYNATPWGVEQAFADLKLRRMWYDTSFEFLVRWGATASDLDGRVPREEMEAVYATLRRWDGLIPETHKSYMASGVWAEFEKV